MYTITKLFVYKINTYFLFKIIDMVIASKTAHYVRLHKILTQSVRPLSSDVGQNRMYIQLK